MEYAPSTLPAGSPPTGYQEVLYWRISERRWRLLVINLVALVLIVPWFAIFGWLSYRIAGTLPGLPAEGPGGYLVGLAAALATLVLHELAHGLAMQAAGAHPRYGLMLSKLMVYATAPGYAFGRGTYVATALAPLVGLSLLSILGMALLASTSWAGLVALCATVNAVGATGDLWILSVVLRYPHEARFSDERDGLRVFLPVPAVWQSQDSGSHASHAESPMQPHDSELHL